jgi:CheY-like chemotaxis protein
VVGLEPAGDPAAGSYRLLVAEDREANRKLLVKLLAPLGFEVREAANGREAIEIWERWNPHLIWMDVRMPVMDGHEATQHIKATPQGQGTVIVALTASAFEEDRTALLLEGCDDFVRKPFREQEILDVLTKHLGVRFVYEGAEEEAKVAEDVLTPDALAALPSEWVAELSRAARQADADLVLELLDPIREQHAPLANALASLVRDFRFDRVIALTQEDNA